MSIESFDVGNDRVAESNTLYMEALDLQMQQAQQTATEEHHETDSLLPDTMITSNDQTTQDRPLTREELAEHALTRFDDWDLDSDGYLSSGELLAKHDQFTGKDLKARFNLSSSHSRFANMSDDGSSNDSGVSRMDLIAASQPFSASNDNTLAYQSIRRFDDWDSDSDGFLSKRELDDARRNRNASFRDLEILDRLYGERRQLEELSNDEFGDENDGITMADLQALETRSQSS